GLKFVVPPSSGGIAEPTSFRLKAGLRTFFSRSQPMDASITAALSFGFILGLRHALDPDHLVAVSTIVSEHKSVARSSLVGTFWGLGHTMSLLLAGIAVIAFRIRIPDRVAVWMEVTVALSLVMVGLEAMGNPPER